MSFRRSVMITAADGSRWTLFMLAVNQTLVVGGEPRLRPALKEVVRADCQQVSTRLTHSSSTAHSTLALPTLNCCLSRSARW